MPQLLPSTIAAASASGLAASRRKLRVPLSYSFGPAAVMAAAVSVLTKPPPFAYLAKLAV